MPRREMASPTRSRSRVRPLSSSPPRLLIAVDAFDDDHIRALSDAAGDGADCDRIRQGASADTYAQAMAAAEVMIGWPEPEWLADSPLKLLLLPSAGYEEYLTSELAAKEGLVRVQRRRGLLRGSGRALRGHDDGAGAPPARVPRGHGAAPLAITFTGTTGCRGRPFA